MKERNLTINLKWANIFGFVVMAVVFLKSATIIQYTIKGRFMSR